MSEDYIVSMEIEILVKDRSPEDAEFWAKQHLFGFATGGMRTKPELSVETIHTKVLPVTGEPWDEERV